MTVSRDNKRIAVLIHQLTELSKDGWRNAKPSDYLPIEAELSLLLKKLATPPCTAS